jgi:hypothetical protein
MATGSSVDRNQLDSIVGDVVGNLNVAIERGKRLAEFLTVQTPDELTGMGYSDIEKTQLNGIENRLRQIHNIYSGQVALAAVFNFQNFFRKLWGLRLD